MEQMTAEQAAEAAKGLTFEKVWAALMETQRQLKESQQETQRQIRESQQEMDESWQKKMDKYRAENEKGMANLREELGGLGRSMGRLTEEMFSTALRQRCNELGYPFTKQGRRFEFVLNGQKLAEVDFWLENGEYAMAVEIKTFLSNDDVDEHLKRVEKIRRYMDIHGDKRKLVGAVAGGAVPDNVLAYAQKQGFYVLVQTSDNVAVAALPTGFKAREW